MFEKTYHSPGVYSEALLSPPERIRTTFQLEMTNEYQQAYFDFFSLSFNLHFGRILKVSNINSKALILQWILLVPFTVMAVVLIFFKEIQTPLPLAVE